MTQFRPMLACKTPDLKSLRYPLLASYKMDGIRAVERGGMLMSRSMKPIPNRAVQAFYKNSIHRLDGMDGELLVGPHDNDVYRRTMSALMSVSGDPVADTVWHIFDNVLYEGGFQERLDHIRDNLQDFSGVKVVPHRLTLSADDVVEHHYQAVADGYEGLILRSIDGRYKNGRSTASEQGMVKVKMFEDSEAEILGWVELMHNANEATTNELGLTKRSSHKANKVGTGVMGALEVKDIHTGVEFEIGTGFTAGERAELDLWRRGRIVKYKFFSGGVKDKPRFPVFLGFRAAGDI